MKAFPMLLCLITTISVALILTFTVPQVQAFEVQAPTQQAPIAKHCFNYFVYSYPVSGDPEDVLEDLNRLGADGWQVKIPAAGELRTFFLGQPRIQVWIVLEKEVRCRR